MTLLPKVSRRQLLGGSAAAVAAAGFPMTSLGESGLGAQDLPKTSSGRQPEPARQMPSKFEQFELPHPSGQGTFKISVSRAPGAAQGAKDVPVLFVLDADMMFGTAAEIAALRGTGGMLPTAMVVGVGYGVGFAEMAKLRTADLTPPLSEAGRKAVSGMASFIGEKSGGAAAFLTFLTDTLAPEIRARYPEASPSHHILFGHSLGGLFTAYALLTRPDAFTTFLASSPSLWWDKFSVIGHLPALAGKLKRSKAQPRAFICVGGKEQDLPTKTSPLVAMTLQELQAMVKSTRMVDAAREFATALRQAGLNDVTHVTFADEDHGSVIAPAVNRGLAIALPAPA